jgi:hypothetical protein
MVISIAIILVFFYWYTLYVCRHVSPHTKHHHTQNCTTLQPSISTHTHTHKYTPTNTLKKTHTHTHKNHTHHAVSHAGCHSFALRELLILSYPIVLSYWYLCNFCLSVSLYFWYWMYICIYTHIVVFGILMEFVLYATIIAGTTKTPTQELCGHCDDDTTTSSSSPVPELLYCFCL